MTLSLIKKRREIARECPSNNNRGNKRKDKREINPTLKYI